MENVTLTISVNRWTAMSLAAVALGFVVVGGAYLATFDATSVFPSVRWTTIAAGLYAVGVTIYMVRPPVRVWVGVSILLLVSSSFLGAVLMTERIRMQSEEMVGALRSVRSDISRSILLGSMSDSLLPAFRVFHGGNSRSPSGLGSAFLNLHPGSLLQVDMNPQKKYWDRTSIVPIEISDSAVVLIGYDTNARGRDPGFVAFSGDTGIVQLRVRITQKGINHDVEN